MQHLPQFLGLLVCYGQLNIASRGFLGKDNPKNYGNIICGQGCVVGIGGICVVAGVVGTSCEMWGEHCIIR